MIKTQTLMNKPFYLGFSILDLSKTVMYEFWYNHVKRKLDENAKLCCIDTYSFIVHVEISNIYKDNAGDVEAMFDTWNCERDRPLPKGKKEVIGIMTDKLGGYIMKEFLASRAKTYCYLKENNDWDKKAKDTKKCAMKRKCTFEDY